jgi:hypothetical protein
MLDFLFFIKLSYLVSSQILAEYYYFLMDDDHQFGYITKFVIILFLFFFEKGFSL